MRTDQRARGRQRPWRIRARRGSGWFDVAGERVGSCWCLPLTKKKGLILLQGDQGKFRRVGTMDVGDLAWFMASEEKEVCLI